MSLSIILIIMLLAIGLQILIHESAHAITAKLTGNKVLEFKPYPHIYNKILYAGRTNIKVKKPLFLPHMYIAPYCIVTIEILTIAFLEFCTSTNTTILIILSIPPFLDATVWTLGFFSITNSDGKKYKEIKTRINELKKILK